MFYQLIACCFLISSLYGAQPAPKRPCIRDGNAQQNQVDLESKILIDPVYSRSIFQFGRFMCVQCHIPYKSEKNLTHHELTEHGRAQGQFIYLDDNDLVSYRCHSPNPAPEKIYISSLGDCNEASQSKSCLQQHIQGKHRTKKFKCPFPACAKPYLYRRVLDNHIKQAHPLPILPLADAIPLPPLSIESDLLTQKDLATPLYVLPPEELSSSIPDPL